MNENKKEIIVADATSISDDEILAKTMKSGKLADAVNRSPKDIKHDRAMTIVSGIERQMRRNIEDQEEELSQLIMRRQSMLDMSPDNTHSIINAKNIDVTAWVKEYSELGLSIHKAKIKLGICKADYSDLFNSGGQ